MTVDESLEQFGLRPPSTALDQIRAVLREETSKESAEQGDGDTELMRLCCVQLFGAGMFEDIQLIWSAKTSSMDADASIDIQLLCGAGLDTTVKYLRPITEQWAQHALYRVEASLASGDFDGFDVRQKFSEYSEYYESED